ncbi:hypothetical protein [Kurthia sibirica]|uniref:hypothetical protein n=1 Tax=Kurthia sibirica TaxID=202750 RepID=UPI0011729EDC|nr:hypothetical protein [Kurthia sibirica]GEK33769.1 hypothetical protein KSI01_13020 [Kurthia sibirica]
MNKKMLGLLLIILASMIILSTFSTFFNTYTYIKITITLLLILFTAYFIYHNVNEADSK